MTRICTFKLNCLRFGTQDNVDNFTQINIMCVWSFVVAPAQVHTDTICRNVFLRGEERGKRHDEIVQENVGREGPAAQAVNPVWSSVVGADPEGDFFESIVDERIVEAIDELPEEYRTAVVLSDVEGLPYAEIAELMGVPVGTVKSRLFRGRRQLQQVLYEYALEMGYISERSGTDA